MTKWRKSTLSEGSNPTACVEIAAILGTVAIRDSKDPDGPQLQVQRHNWRHLTDSIKTGTFDLAPLRP